MDVTHHGEHTNQLPQNFLDSSIKAKWPTKIPQANEQIPKFSIEWGQFFFETAYGLFKL